MQRSDMDDPRRGSRGLVFGAIADDLTGAVELASILVANGVPTELFVGLPREKATTNAEAVVIAVRTRVAAADQAVSTFQAAQKWLAPLKPQQTFFKYCATFDSTPAGNIGCCTDALIDAVGAKRTLFVPSFPENGRTVYGGHLFVGDQLVSASTKRFDPLTPMDDPDLVAVLKAQTDRGVGLLPRRITAAGTETAMAFLDMRAREGIHYFIADALDDDDLDKLATLTVDWPLMTGGSTIVDHFPALWRARRWIGAAAPRAGIPPVKGPGAVISGSCSDRTLAQLAAFENARHPVFRIDLRSGTADAIVKQARSWAEAKMAEGPIAIATSADVEEVASIQSSMGRDASARKAEEVLGRIASMLVEMGVRRLAVAGGETSGAVLSALETERLTVGPYVPRGIALASTNLPAGLIGFCLKSGRIGSDDVFMERLAAMETGGYDE